MCLIVFGWDVHPKYKLILAANRDEFYARPTAAAGFWKDHPEILGGRDLEAGGTWMAVSKNGQLAAVTNYRDLKNLRTEVASRGEIPVNFLTGHEGPAEYIERLEGQPARYNGFNTLIGDADTLLHYSNYERKLNRIKPGIHGLSNALLNTSWPKVVRAKNQFEQVINHPFGHKDLVEMMGDTQVADDSMLPDTGVSYELEKALSAMCIRTKNYGTCSTTVITLERSGKVEFTEKTFPAATTNHNNMVHFQFDMEQ